MPNGRNDANAPTRVVDKRKYCFWCMWHEGKQVAIEGKVYTRDIGRCESAFKNFYTGDAYFHKDCLIKQIEYDLSLEERDFNRKKEALLKEIEEVKKQ